MTRNAVSLDEIYSKLTATEAQGFPELEGLLTISFPVFSGI